MILRLYQITTTATLTDRRPFVTKLATELTRRVAEPCGLVKKLPAGRLVEPPAVNQIISSAACYELAK